MSNCIWVGVSMITSRNILEKMYYIREKELEPEREAQAFCLVFKIHLVISFHDELKDEANFVIVNEKQK